MNKRIEQMEQISQEDCEAIFCDEAKVDSCRMHIDEKRITKAELIQVVRNQEDAIDALNNQILKNNSKIVCLKMELDDSVKKQIHENCTEVETEQLGDAIEEIKFIIGNLENITLDRITRREKEYAVIESLQAAERIKAFFFDRPSKREE